MQKITELDNGLRIVTQNMPGLETISMGIWNAVGGRDEIETNNGVAHLLEHMACLLYTSPSPRDQRGSRMPSSA